MELSIKSISLLAAVTLSGLSAGFFYAWAVSVIPGTRKIADPVYLETMQSINRAILNPAFYIVFFGCLALLVLASFQQYYSPPIFWLLLAATLTYLFGTFGVTAFGNVPLNNLLDALDLQELGATQMSDFREGYELKWNRLHMIRTVFSTISFVFSVLAVYVSAKSI